MKCLYLASVLCAPRGVITRGTYDEDSVVQIRKNASGSQGFWSVVARGRDMKKVNSVKVHREMCGSIVENCLLQWKRGNNEFFVAPSAME